MDRIVAPLALAGGVVVASMAQAQFLSAPVELLTHGKVVAMRHRAGKPTRFVLRARLTGRALPAREPACPLESSVEIAFASSPTGYRTTGAVPLPCEGWRVTRRGGRRFRSPDGFAGSITEIVYGPKRLVIRAEGDGIDFVAGPVAYLQTWLTIGEERFLVRVHDFKKNDASRIVSRRPTGVGAGAEAAFWDTVWGDAPRADEALQLLEKAVGRRGRDGRSHFLLGMLHLWRLQDSDPLALTRPESEAVLEAQRHLDAAVELLPTDPRVAGFRAATTYVNGRVHQNAELEAIGLTQLDEAVAIDPVFNGFDYFAIAPFFPVRGDSDFFQTRFVTLADVVLRDNLDCPTMRPEVCGNAGMAPHNVEGTFVLLGDVYAKGGRPDDAEQWWRLASTLGASGGWAYVGLLDDRIGAAAARSELYADDDPTNDPPFMDGDVGYCRYCHEK
jgi:hypothetical protein